MSDRLVFPTVSRDATLSLFLYPCFWGSVDMFEVPPSSAKYKKCAHTIVDPSVYTNLQKLT